jgi:hypothetical protein
MAGGDCRVAGGWWLVAGGWWLVAGGWWLVAGGWWLVAGSGWLVAHYLGCHLFLRLLTSFERRFEKDTRRGHLHPGWSSS